MDRRNFLAGLFAAPAATLIPLKKEGELYLPDHRIVTPVIAELDDQALVAYVESIDFNAAVDALTRINIQLVLAYHDYPSTLLQALWSSRMVRIVPM